MIKKIFLISLWSFILVQVTNCSHKQDQVTPYLSKTSFKEIKNWALDDHSKALKSFLESCKTFNKFPPHKRIETSQIKGKAEDWQKICQHASQIDKNDLKQSRYFFENNFYPYALHNDNNYEGLFTGYYVPELKGSWIKTPRFRFPILKKPAIRGNLPSRADMEKGAFRGRGLEILWVDNFIDRFFLHVQGSGKVKMTDGQIIRLAYDGHNNKPYFSIGKYLVENGHISADEISMQSIKIWLSQNTEKVMEVLNLNPRYIFFKITEDRKTRGASGSILTAKRSIAIDPNYIPYGSPIWVDLESAPTQDGKLRQLLIAQDTGSAIRGVVRGDFFWGFGSEAENKAGKMKAIGRSYLLLPKSLNVQYYK